jgi:hypothetical protein
LTLLGRLHRISVRQRGGIYFLPKTAEAELEKIENVINSLPGDCYISAAPQIDADKSRTAIYKAFSAELRSKLAKFREEIDTKTANPSKSKQVKCWKDRIEEFKALRDEISFYADAIKFQGEDLAQELVALEAEVQEAFLKG